MWKKLTLSFSTFTIIFLIFEIVARLYMPNHAPVLLRDGIYTNSLPLVTGFIQGSFEGIPTGEPLPEDKPEGEIRIFVYGESSVAGVPLDLYASAPTMLYDLLTEVYPDHNIKVINMGRTGSISANVYYYLLATRRYDPDYIIFYMGINDDQRMPGEQCMPVRHPHIHQAWQWLVEHSWLLWTIRVFGPQFFWSGEKGSDMSKWDCPEDPFPKWTDVLVETAVDTGARVIVTTPVHSMVAKIEPGLEPSKDGSVDFYTMRESYRRLLICRLSKDCDFSAAFKIHATSAGEWKGDMRGGPLVYQNIILDHKKEAWRAPAERFGAEFIDFRSALEAASPSNILAEIYFSDEIHLSLEGYNYLARFWAERLKTLMDGTPLKEPAIPTAKDVERYRMETKVIGASMANKYLQRGWYLTAIPGLDFAAGQCQIKPCTDEYNRAESERAAIELGWLRYNVGLDPDLPPHIALKNSKFNVMKLKNYIYEQKKWDISDPKTDPLIKKIYFIINECKGKKFNGFKLIEVVADSPEKMSVTIKRKKENLKLIIGKKEDKKDYFFATALFYISYYNKTPVDTVQKENAIKELAHYLEKGLNSPQRH